jgi:hypothetical protein
MGADSEFDLTLAKVSRRLDQLTRPTFDRATVEELLTEITRLRNEPHRNHVAKELAWRDNHIDDLQEDHDEELLAAGRRIHELELLNTRLGEANQALAAQLGMLVPKPLFRAPTEAEAVVRGVDAMSRNRLMEGLRIISNGPRQD